MFGQILYTQLRWTRDILIAFAVLAFALPTFVWRIGADITWTEATALQVIAGFNGLGASLGLLAATSGFVLVAYVWTIDAAARHVYPLSLPVSWGRYVGMRFGAGALTLLIPTLAVWLGSLTVLALIELPPTLRAYPGTLALRFLLGATLAYALSFLLQYLFGRRAAVTLGVVLIVVLGTTVLLEALGLHAVGARLGTMLLEWPGPLAVFANDWALVDV